MSSDGGTRRRRATVFYPSGQVGLVCDGSAACLSEIGTASFIVVSTLRQFTVYDASALKVSFVSLPMPCDIRHIATKLEHVFVVLANNQLLAFHRYDQRPIENRHTGEVLGIITAESGVITFSRKEVITYEHVVQESGSPGGAAAPAQAAEPNKSQQWRPKKVIPMPDNLQLERVVPLSGFKNKVLLCASNGQVHLCNVSTGNLIHTFEFSDAVLLHQIQEGSQTISAIAQSQLQSNSVVAVGYRSGDVLIVDIKNDQVLGSLKLSNQQQHATSLAFVYDALGRMDRGSKSIVANEALVIGTANGDLVVFDLSEFRIFGVVEKAHLGPVKHLLYVERDNNLVTAGTDNCLILWAMDSEKELLRHYKDRRGLIGEINMMKTYDSEEMDLLVCSSADGVGYLGKASTIQQMRCNTFSTSASKARIRKITAIATCYQRHYDWSNIATCHQNTHVVHLWSGHRRALVEGVLKAPNTKEAATAVCISSCGNYVAVGYNNGQMHLFNLQSTNHEDEFVVKVSGERRPAHSSTIIAMFLLAGVQLVSISDSKKDQAIRVWDISSVSLKDTYEPGLPKGTRVTLAVGGHLLTALACSNGVIYLVDIIGKMVIRSINYGKVTSMSFHPNGTWFIANASDSTMVIYDILAACYVEYAKFTGNVLAVHIDSGGAFLNLSVEKAPGIIMQYANRHVFEINSKTMLYTELGKEPVVLQLPFIVTDHEATGDITDTADQKDETEQTILRPEYNSATEPLAESLISLSGFSSGKLQSILFLDEIKEKSKPIEPPKALEEVPFFLPTTYKDGQLVFVDPLTSGAIQEEKPKPKSSFIKPGDILGEFEALLLAKETKNEKYEKMINYLLNQTPSGVHLALSTLSTARRNEALSNMLNFFVYHQGKKTNYDAQQVFLHVFLKYHGEAITKLKGSAAILESLGAGLQEDNRKLQTHFDRISCFIKFVTNLQME